MRKTILKMIIFIISMNLCNNGSAEFVFKKSGEIIKGRIVSEDASKLTVRSDAGKAETISRSDIMRVLYTDLYMGKVFVRLTSGEVVEGYQVDEDRDNYIFRKDINKPEEFTILRKKVMFIARTNPTDLTGRAYTDHIDLKWSPPFKPAKLYQVYAREVKKDSQFGIAGETDALVFTLKSLQKSISYEIYVTAIGDDGSESLPSEKIISNTLPEAPEDLEITEKYSDNGKTVTLTFRWKTVTDPLSRVKSYNITRNENGEDKKGYG